MPPTPPTRRRRPPRRGAAGADGGAAEADPPADPHAPSASPRCSTRTGSDAATTDVLGGVAAHLYTEFDRPADAPDPLDPARLETAVRALAARHPALRTRITPDGLQQVLAAPPGPLLTVEDLRGLAPEAAAARLDELRDACSHQMLDIEAGRVFDIRLTLLPDGATRLHVDVDMAAADALSFRILLADLAALYAAPGTPLPPLAYDHRAYLADRPRRCARRGRGPGPRALGRPPGRPARSPDLPLRAEAERGDPARVTPPPPLARPRRQAAAAGRAHQQGAHPGDGTGRGLRPRARRWTAEPHFLLNLPLFDREEIHPDVPRLVGDFTGSVLLDSDLGRPARSSTVPAPPGSAARRRRACRPRRAGGAARPLPGPRGQVVAPVVCTSALNLGELFADDVRALFGEPEGSSRKARRCCSTPRSPKYAAVSSSTPGHPRGTPRGRRRGRHVRRLPHRGHPPRRSRRRLGPADRRPPAGHPAHGARPGQRHHGPPQPRRLTTRSSPAPAPGPTPSRSSPDPACAGPTATSPTARARRRRAGRPRHRPERHRRRHPSQGARPVLAVLGVLAAGAAYVLVGVEQPAARRARIRATAGARLVLDADGGTGASPRAVAIALAEAARHAEPLAAPTAGDERDAAYILFTSGSTGEPKGVELPHSAAVNTIDDLVAWHALGPDDRTLALSVPTSTCRSSTSSRPAPAGGAGCCRRPTNGTNRPTGCAG
ncbi:AMP-binding protein [Yinghuangia aomiensis]